MHDIYVTSDVLLLSDIIETFRNHALKINKIDPYRYYSGPGFSKDVYLKQSDVKLSMLNNKDVYDFIKNAIRGGNVQAVRRYAKANHKYLSDYDPLQPSVFIMAEDMNNLYGGGMRMKLPEKYLDVLTDISVDDIDRLESMSDRYYLCCSKITYPKELHDLHNDYPLMCDIVEINGVRKLCMNLFDKEQYTCNMTYLKFLKDHGLVIEKYTVH